MASEGMDLVPPQRMENGLNPQMVFQDEALQFSARKTREVSGFVDEKMFSVERERFFGSAPGVDFRRSIFESSPGRREQPENQNWNNGDGSTGTPSGDGLEGEEEEEDEDEDDDDEDDDEGDGEVEGLVVAGNGNNKNNNSNSSVHSSSEKLRNEKANLQKHHTSFGSRRGLLLDGNVVQTEQHQQGRVNFENAVNIAEPDVYYTQFLQGSDGNGTVLAQKEMGGDNCCGISGRKDGSLSSESGESLRAILSDPISGLLMDDAMILPCGHSFGSGGMQSIIRMKTCCTCSRPVSEDSVAPNLSLRSAVQAFRREEELLSYRSKRRRDRFEQEKCSFGDPFLVDNSRGRGVQFPFSVTDRVIIKGNKRTPQRFVGREAVVTTQCLNGWYVVKTLDNAESVKLQYRSLAKVPDNPSLNTMPGQVTTANWL